MKRSASRVALFCVAAIATIGGTAWAATHSLTTCASTTACLGGTNSAGGPGVLGTSATGIGVQGTSTKSNPAITATTGAPTGIRGNSATGTGVRGISTSSNGVVGITSSSTVAAVVAQSTGKTAPYAVTASAPAGTGVGATGLTAFSGVGHGICPTSGCIYDTNANYDAIAAMLIQSTGTQTPFVLRNAKGAVVFSVDDLGTVFFAGKLVCPNASFVVYNYKTMASYTVCVASQLDRTLLKARGERPVEFDGVATLTRGIAKISIPAEFAGKADRRAPYRVFLSALGDTGGPLRVDQRAAQSFIVRAPAATKFPIQFSYRIVAPQAGTAIASVTNANVAAPRTVLPTDAETGASRSDSPGVAPQATATPCSLTVACTEGENTGTGIGVEGTSKTGYGVEGVSPGTAGVGIEGNAVAGIGAYGLATSGYGVHATSTSGTALVGSTSSKTSAGVLGESTATKNGVGFEASSTYGGGISSSGAQSFSGTGLVQVTGVYGGPLLLIHNPSAKIDVFSVDDGGIVGFNHIWNCPAVYSSAEGTCLGVTSLTGNEEKRVERTGEARLLNGVATVALDPWLAAHLDRSQPYTVDVTPEGDSNGWIYVDTRTPGSFTVREHGGHSSIAFEYDIIANTIGLSH